MDTNQPLVSVIIPLYNRARFLPQLFKTLDQQDYQHFELIIVDDGSEDDAEEWLKNNKLARDQNTIYVKQKNAGPYAARNNGLSHASGEIIAFQDSDDEWPPYHISELVSLLNENPDVDWVFGSIERIDHNTREVVEASNFRDANGKLHPFVTLKSEKRKDGLSVIVDPEAGSVAIKHQVPGSTQCGLIRAKVFEDIQFDPSYRTAYDRFFAIKCVLKGYRFGIVDRTHQIYHIHDDHISLVAGGDAEKRAKSAATMIRGYSELMDGTITGAQKEALKTRLAEIYSWQLSLAQKEQGEYSAAVKSMSKAFTLVPSNILYAKSLIVSVIRFVLSKLKLI